MCMMHLAARWASSTGTARQFIVANFDHGTGKFAEDAAVFVRSEAERLGLPFVGGKAVSPGRTEAEWRKQRWEFLERVARDARISDGQNSSVDKNDLMQERDVVIATAHTLDDQLETVFMRIMRDAGARGLVGLQRESSSGDSTSRDPKKRHILRPVLSFRRSQIIQFLETIGAGYLEDPSNTSRAHLRNRVRLDILPAIRMVDPAFDDFLLGISERAGTIREVLDGIANEIPISPGPVHQIPLSSLAGLNESELRTLWPAILAKIGIVMDWRGTERLAKFTIRCETGKQIQLSGGIKVAKGRYSFGVTKRFN